MEKRKNINKIILLPIIICAIIISIRVIYFLRSGKGLTSTSKKAALKNSIVEIKDSKNTALELNFIKSKKIMSLE